MATDVDVQYFSHLNGLILGNNWGDLIRLLDTCLVNGLPLTSINSASIDAQGDITLNLYADHSCMLFQIIELTGFTPSDINGKYRIKGVPSATQLILKATHAGKSITTTGSAKLASLGYEIIFRDVNDVKRVYRAKNPTAQHPFIRVDESLTSPDGVTGVYDSSYAKYAMVGLLERMGHIDDYENPDVLQLPFDPADPAKNWKITGRGTGVVRGWSKWYSATNSNPESAIREATSPSTGNQLFTLVGDSNIFYFIRTISPPTHDVLRKYKILSGCGVYYDEVSKNYEMVLLTSINTTNADTNFSLNSIANKATLPLVYSDNTSQFFIKKISLSPEHILAKPIIPTFTSGNNNLFTGGAIGALQIPFVDDQAYLRGTLQHACYSGKNHDTNETTLILADASMYCYDSLYVAGGGGMYFYLGELE